MNNGTIIDFARLEREQEAFARQWRGARPFELIVVDDFADAGMLRRVLDAFPAPESLNKSRDYIFAKEKYEKNRFEDICPEMGQLHGELVSGRFAAWLKGVTGIEMFVDPAFHGGGLHSGGRGSFLDMHADFNVHPLHGDWLREVNILLYLNPDWRPEWGGELKLRHRETGEARVVEPLFNRCVVMLTKDHTLHGYDPISFPEGVYRRSIATYGYSLIPEGVRIEARSTDWRSEQSWLRRAAGPLTLRLVALKNRLFGSGSSLNQ